MDENGCEIFPEDALIKDTSAKAELQEHIWLCTLGVAIIISAGEKRT